MRPLAEFEVHSAGDIVGDSWLALVHKTCGASIGSPDGYDMIDLETAVDLAVGHVCDNPYRENAE